MAGQARANPGPGHGHGLAQGRPVSCSQSVQDGPLAAGGIDSGLALDWCRCGACGEAAGEAGECSVAGWGREKRFVQGLHLPVLGPQRCQTPEPQTVMVHGRYMRWFSG